MLIAGLVRPLYDLIVLVVSLRLKLCVTLRDFVERRSRRFSFQAVLFLLPSLFLWAVLELLFHIATYKRGLIRPDVSSILSLNVFGNHLLLFVELLASWFAFYAILRWSPLGYSFWLWLLYEASIVTYAVGLGSIPFHLPEIYSSLTTRRPTLAKMVQTAETRHAMREWAAPIFVDTSEHRPIAQDVGIAKYSAIVLSEGILRRLDDAQLLFVVGHELGHLADSFRKNVVLGCVMLVEIFLAYHLGARIIVWYGPGLGIRGVQDWAGLPLFAICFVLLGTVRALGMNRYQLHLEDRADCFGVEFIAAEVENPVEVAASALIELNTDDPSRKSELRMGPRTHPSVAERIASIGRCEKERVDQRIPAKCLAAHGPQLGALP